MTAQPPFDPGAYRSDAVPSDTQAIYIQEGALSRAEFCSTRRPTHPKILRLQEIMIVSALLSLDPRCYFLGRHRITCPR